MTDERRWTVEDANATLPWVGERLAAALGALEAARAAGNAPVMVRTNGHGTLPTDLETAQAIVEEIQAAGIVVRDLDRGLIDFPANAPSGRTYLLCWLAGEPEITWWHWPDAGFAGRTPLSEPPE